MADDIAYETPAAALAPGRRPRRRWARGVDRPAYLKPGDLDRLMIMLVALTAEVSALRDRIDTHEALVDAEGEATTAAVEAFVPPAPRRAAREVNRQAMLKRVLRAITEEREAAVEGRKRDNDDVDPPA